MPHRESPQQARGVSDASDAWSVKIGSPTTAARRSWASESVRTWVSMADHRAERAALGPPGGVSAGERGLSALVVILLLAGGCALPSATRASPRGQGNQASIDAIAGELDALSRGLTAEHRDTFRGLLEDALAKDGYLCWPSPRSVFFGDKPEGSRTIAGEMPHYGFFFGPMRYAVSSRAGRWEVRVTIGVEPPRAASMELPDCELIRERGEGS